MALYIDKSISSLKDITIIIIYTANNRFQHTWSKHWQNWERNSYIIYAYSIVGDYTVPQSEFVYQLKTSHLNGMKLKIN